MSRFLVTYDLVNPGQNYQELDDLITNSYDYAERVTASSWAITAEGRSADVRDRLQHVLDHNDKFIVVRLAGAPAWSTSGLDGLLEDWSDA